MTSAQQNTPNLRRALEEEYYDAAIDDAVEGEGYDDDDANFLDADDDEWLQGQDVNDKDYGDDEEDDDEFGGWEEDDDQAGGDLNMFGLDDDDEALHDDEFNDDQYNDDDEYDIEFEELKKLATEEEIVDDDEFADMYYEDDEEAEEFNDDDAEYDALEGIDDMEDDEYYEEEEDDTYYQEEVQQQAAGAGAALPQVKGAEDYPFQNNYNTPIVEEPQVAATAASSSTSFLQLQDGNMATVAVVSGLVLLLAAMGFMIRSRSMGQTLRRHGESPYPYHKFS